MEKQLIIDSHSHLWLKQDTTWNGMPIRTLDNGRSLFLGEEVQMLPPFMIDGRNSAEVFLSNMDYAQVAARLTYFAEGLGKMFSKALPPSPEHLELTPQQED